MVNFGDLFVQRARYQASKRQFTTVESFQFNDVVECARGLLEAAASTTAQLQAKELYLDVQLPSTDWLWGAEAMKWGLRLLEPYCKDFKPRKQLLPTRCGMESQHL